jgi:peptide deformylase
MMRQNIEILQLGNPILRMTAVTVEDVKSSQLVQIVKQMLEILSNSNGVGLAAPQIGYSVCVIVVASKPTSRYPDAPLMEPVVMINPSFKALSNEQEKDWEGCLSIPGVRALVPRYKNIRVSYTDINGEKTSMVLSGFIARIFQHEYDHLEGLVYLDRIENNHDIISETEFFKLQAA